MPISKRERLIQHLDRVGLNRLLESVARRPGLLVLAYHRIGDCAQQFFDDELFSATADQFRAQIISLRRQFDILSLDSLAEAMQGGRLKLKHPSAVITFDDGYRDNREIAFPILRELGVSAIFFVAAGYIERPRLTWWDSVAFIVKRTKREVLELDYPSHLTLDFQETTRPRAIQRILQVYKQTEGIDQDRFLERLAMNARVSIDPETLGRDLFMSWNQVRELKQGGMEIGGHTYDHPVLSRISVEAQRRELSFAKERLEAETGSPVRLMAYPVGKPDCFDDVTKRLAKEVGYAGAFSYYGGFNRSGHADLFDIRRIAVERDDSLPMFRFRTQMNNLCGRGVL